MPSLEDPVIARFMSTLPTSRARDLQGILDDECVRSSLPESSWGKLVALVRLLEETRSIPESERAWDIRRQRRLRRKG
jgi:hypothetical protein